MTGVFNKNTMMKKMYPNDWASLHPYKGTDEADVYYSGLVGRVAEEGLRPLFKDYLTEDELFSISNCLTLWFEDVVSECGIWTAYTGECKRRYGSYVPFYSYDESDYIPGEINYVDVCFVLWMILVSETDELTYYPKNESLEKAAKRLYNLFDREFEKAPINDRLYDALHPELDKSDLFYSVREYLFTLWHCFYIDMDMSRVIQFGFDHIMEKHISDDNLSIFLNEYAIKCFTVRREWRLGLTLMEWGALIISQNDDELGEILLNSKCQDKSVKLVYDKDDEYIYLKELVEVGGDDSRTYKVKLNCFDNYDKTLFTPGETCVDCRLIHFDGQWLINGVSTIKSYDEVKKAPEQYFRLSIEKQHEADADIYNKVRDILGENIFYVNSSREAAELGKSIYKGKQIFDENIIAGIDGPTAIVFTPDDGTDFIFDNVECLCDVRNPFYNEWEARRNAIEIITSDGICSYSCARHLWEHGMLSDAAFEGDCDYEERKRLVKDNIRFILDYFFCNNLPY